MRLKTTIRQLLSCAAGAMALFAALGTTPAQADPTVICYNCPPEWADWAGQVEAIQKDLGIQVPLDNKNSGQALAQMIAEREAPVADVVYLGITSAIDAAKKGLLAPYKPKHWDQIPADLKDPNGLWFSIHSGTIGFFVNRDALEGKPVPKSWADLLKPEYRGMVGYLDPSSAFVGYAAAVAINSALGGSIDNFGPALDYLKKLKKNDPIVPKQTSYARVLSGEIPILLDFDFNAYRAIYKDHANVQFVIPTEGSVALPYVMALVKGAPHAADARKVLDYTLSDKGQAHWAQAYLRPVRQEALTPEMAKKFLPKADYDRVRPVDLAKLADEQSRFSQDYLKNVR